MVQPYVGIVKKTEIQKKTLNSKLKIEEKRKTSNLKFDVLEIMDDDIKQEKWKCYVFSQTSFLFHYIEENSSGLRNMMALMGN